MNPPRGTAIPWLYWITLAAAWAVAAAMTFGVVSWHDPTVQAYWDEVFEKGDLFLTQRGFRPGPSDEPILEPTASYPAWLAVMRYEADLSIGLAAASAGQVLVNAVRLWRWNDAWRGPGVVACSVATAALVVCLLEEVSRSRKAGQALWGNPSNPFPNDWPHVELSISLAVFGAWVMMAAVRAWRPQPAWADRLGTAIGSLWLLAMVYRMVGSLVIPFGNWGY